MAATGTELMLPEPQDWARLDAVLLQALDAEPAERTALLARLQQEDPNLAQRLAQLLEHAEHCDPRLDPAQLDRRAAWEALDTDAATREPARGTRIGAWRLLRHLGRGGMGSVYEVARADGAYQQRAALKLILGEVDSREFLERFARERQILALLNHPGIARLLDGGEDASGHPYLVMEFVAGTSIDRFCAEQRIDLPGRLRLFLQVAEAVEHAHRQRVVHRDLKPSNILVAAAGEAKLLDFGIAKVLAEDTAAAATRTALLLTPQYCAPEQVLGKPVDARSDIYQLGLLLFELLTTQRAQEPIDLTPAALLAAVCSANRPLPSACAAAAAAERCAQIGGLDPAALARRLRGDLDWIVAKALRQEPERRYASVQAFADDVRRYLDGAPVQARPETLAYRMSKFVRRHPWGVTSSAAAFVLMAAYALTATWLMRENAAQRDRATTQARTAEQVKTLVLRMFETANPEQSLGRTLSAKDLLDSSWPLIETETRNQPEVQVELLNTLGETYRQLGDYAQALARLQRAQQLIHDHPQLPRQLRAASLRTLGRLLIERGEHDRAETVLLQARQLLQADAGSQSGGVALAATLKELGYLQQRRGKEAAAEPFYMAAIEAYQRAPGDQRRATLEAMERLAVAYSNQAKYVEAAGLLETTLRLQAQLLPPNHPDIAGNFANLAELRRQQGRFADAEAQYRKAWALMQRARGAEHPDVALIMNNLARVLASQGKLAEAETLLVQALAIRRQQLGEQHELVAMSRNDLGDVYQARGASAAAEQQYQQGLAILPPAHPGRGAILGSLGRLLEARGDLAGAAAMYGKTLELRRVRFGNHHDLVADTLQRLGTVQLALGQRSQARASLNESLAILRQHFEPAHPRVAAVTRLLEQLGAARAADVGQLTAQPSDQ